MPLDKHTPEEMSGRVKEAAGDLAGNAKLEHEGQADQASAHVKRGVDRVAEAVKDVIAPDGDKDD